MGRRPKSSEQHVQVYYLWQRGMGPRSIALEIAKTYGETAYSMRSIKSFVAKFKKSPREDDQPLDLGRLIQTGLPPDSVAFVAQMWAFVQECGHVPTVPHKRNDGWSKADSTVRHAKQWWHVRCLCPELSLFDIFWLAQWFVGREVICAITGVSHSNDDLHAFLAYKPWANPVANQRYGAAIREGRVRALTVDSSEALDTPHTGILQDSTDWRQQSAPSSPRSGGQVAMLPSSWLAMLLRNARTKRETQHPVSLEPEPRNFGAAAPLLRLVLGSQVDN